MGAGGTAGGWAGLLWLGLVALGLGGAADLSCHLLPRPLADGLEPLLGPEGARAHLATLAGMVAVFLAVARRGLRPGREVGARGGGSGRQPARGPPEARGARQTR